MTPLPAITSKSFRGDIDIFLGMLERKEPFAIARYGDGELAVIQNKQLDNGEFSFYRNEKWQAARQLLIESFKYQAPNYYVGIGCPCCIGQEDFDYSVEESGQSITNLTWSNIFVNSNFDYFAEKGLPLFDKFDHKVITFNKTGSIAKLPFGVDRVLLVGKNAWVDDQPIISRIEDLARTVSGALFLFAAGPFANILVTKAHAANPENTYIDIGSALNKYLFIGQQQTSRGYLRGASTLSKTCVWG
jgi:hypothetical protein